MIQDILRNKYWDKLKALDIYENNTSLKLTRIIVKPELRNSGVGTNVLKDLIKSKVSSSRQMPMDGKFTPLKVVVFTIV